MNLFSKMRITHKISALMIGLALGFISIGITYYFQVSLSDKASNLEKDAFIFQQKISELKQLELNLKFQVNQLQVVTSGSIAQQINESKSDIEKKLNEIHAVESSEEYRNQLDSITNLVKQYTQILDKKVSGLAVLRESSSNDTRAELEASFTEIEDALKNTAGMPLLNQFGELKLAMISYLNAANDISREDIESKNQYF